MCLSVDYDKSKEWYQALVEAGDKGIKFHKYLKPDKKAKTLKSPIRPEFTWNPGVNVSSRKKPDRNKAILCRKINTGIHALTPEAISSHYRNKNRRKVWVIGYAKDFVAAGKKGDIVFTKVTLSQGQYNKVMK